MPGFGYYRDPDIRDYFFNAQVTSLCVFFCENVQRISRIQPPSSSISLPHAFSPSSLSLYDFHEFRQLFLLIQFIHLF